MISVHFVVPCGGLTTQINCFDFLDLLSVTLSVFYNPAFVSNLFMFYNPALPGEHSMSVLGGSMN